MEPSNKEIANFHKVLSLSGKLYDLNLPRESMDIIWALVKHWGEMERMVVERHDTKR